MFIVIEGADGSGKSTQFKLTVERLKAIGHEVEVFKFPQYSEPSSVFIKNYLNGEYGPASEVSPYTASLFYALDRYHTAPKIRQALAEGKVVVADRYVGSNMAHQGSKFASLAEQRGFFLWEDSLEYQLLGIPRPDMNIYLRVPVEISAQLMKERAQQPEQSKLDEHEADKNHLKKTIATYDLLCRLFPRDFVEINCAPQNKLLGIVEINDQIWELLKPLLPPPSKKPTGAVVQLSEKALTTPKEPKDKLSLQKPKRSSHEPVPIKSIIDNAPKPAAKNQVSTKLKLTKVEPRNELDLLLEKFGSSVEGWNYQQKQSRLGRELPSLLRGAKYEFETNNQDKARVFSAAELSRVPSNDRALYGSMIEKVAEVHPLVGRYLKEHYAKSAKSKRSHKQPKKA